MSKKPLYTIKSSTCGSFTFGNCAVIAIARAFKKKYKYVLNLFDFVGINARDGVTTKEIKKMVDFLCKEKELHNKYYSNKNCISIKTFLETHRKGTFLISFDFHLAYLKNGVFYDDYLTERRLEDNKQNKVYGWWEISKEESLPVAQTTSYTSWVYRYA